MVFDYYSYEYLAIGKEGQIKTKFLFREGHYKINDDYDGLPDNCQKILYKDGQWFIKNTESIEQYSEIANNLGFKMTDPITILRRTIYE